MMRRELGYFLGAVGFFTRLPVPGWVGHSAAALSQCARYFPAVGLLVGGIGALVYWLALHLWPQPVAVLLSMAATIYATGAFHEDGLSDTADGLGGGWDKARILAIMKDSRVGSYGVVALVLALLGKFALLSGIDAALVASRLAQALLDYCVFCHRSAEAGHRTQLLAMGAEPLLDLGLRLGEGTGAALAYPLVNSAVAFLNEMASFESAGVSDQG